MNKYFLFFFVFLSLPIIYCSECTDKKSLNSGENEEICSSFKPDSHEKICIYDSTTKGCMEKGCTDLNSDQCNQINNNPYDMSEGYKKCIPKTDNSGCELVFCTEMKTDCDRYLPNNEDEKCVLKSDKSGCEIQRCSDLSTNCGEFIPIDEINKCALNETTKKCKITYKDCVDFDIEKCENYYNFVDGTKCVPDSKTNKCKLISCEELSSSECSKYEIHNLLDKVCAPSGEKCKIQSCEDFSQNVCETVQFSYYGFKCRWSQDGCTFLDCDSLTSNCEQFIPINPIYKCYYNAESRKCMADYKECQDFTKGQCDLFNIEHNLEIYGKKCVEENGKCVLESSDDQSKKFEVSIFIILFLLFLF